MFIYSVLHVEEAGRRGRGSQTEWVCVFNVTIVWKDVLPSDIKGTILLFVT